MVLLLAAWLVLNDSLAPDILIPGILLSALVSWLFCRTCTLFDKLNLTARSFFYSVIYLFVFVKELVLSNIDVAIRVLSPSLPIRPAVVKGTTTLKSKMGRMILANSITLTPGTFTLDIKGDTLYIHCLTLEGADGDAYAKSVIRKFEKYLEVIYG